MHKTLNRFFVYLLQVRPEERVLAGGVSMESHGSLANVKRENCLVNDRNLERGWDISGECHGNFR